MRKSGEREEEQKWRDEWRKRFGESNLRGKKKARGVKNWIETIFIFKN